MKNIFDILENTEDDIMETITDLSPELDEAKFEKLFAKSERDYKIKKKEMERAKKEEFTEENSVSGVERFKRPIWFRPLMSAASFVLIAGAVIGTVSTLKKHKDVTGGEKVSYSATTEEAQSSTADNSSAVGMTTNAVMTVVTDSKSAKTGTSVTSATVSTAETEDTQSNTTTSFAEPDAKDIYINDDLSSYAYDIYRRAAAFNDAVQGIELGRKDEYLKFAIDPEVRINSFDYENKNGEILYNTLFYQLVDDARYTCFDDLKKEGRSIFTEDCWYYSKVVSEYRSGFDEVENGGLLESNNIGSFIEYRGKLYIKCENKNVHYGPAGKETKEYPAIIADKTDTSFTAFIRSDCSDVTAENGYICWEIKFELDPEFNDWRIAETLLHDAPVYKEMYEKQKGLE